MVKEKLTKRALAYQLEYVIKAKVKDEIQALLKRYCDENGSYKVGDVFKDHKGKIRIEEIHYYLLEEMRACHVYKGVKLNKDGTVAKGGKKRFAFGHDDVIRNDWDDYSEVGKNGI